MGFCLSSSSGVLPSVNLCGLNTMAIESITKVTQGLKSKQPLLLNLLNAGIIWRLSYQIASPKTSAEFKIIFTDTVRGEKNDNYHNP